jgi:hypothetical protein
MPVDMTYSLWIPAFAGMTERYVTFQINFDSSNTKTNLKSKSISENRLGRFQYENAQQTFRVTLKKQNGTVAKAAAPFGYYDVA